MEFKVGQKYKIVDIDAWWDKEAYVNGNMVDNIYVEHQNGDILTVGIHGECLQFINDNGRESQDIDSLTSDKRWHDSCVELIEE